MLLRRLIRRRWNAIYGPLVSSKKRRRRRNINAREGSDGDGDGDSDDEEDEDEDEDDDDDDDHPLRYAVPWVDGPASGETWAFGAPLARRRDPSLFTVSLGSASPNKGDITVDMHQNPKLHPPTPHPLLTSRVGPGEDVLIGGGGAVSKLSHVPPTPERLTLSAIFNGAGGGEVKVRPVRPERNFGDRPLDVPLGVATLTRGQTLVPLVALLEGATVPPLRMRLTPGSEVKIGRHVLQVDLVEPLLAPVKDAPGVAAAPWRIRLRHPFHPRGVAGFAASGAAYDEEDAALAAADAGKDYDGRKRGDEDGGEGFVTRVA